MLRWSVGVLLCLALTCRGENGVQIKSNYDYMTQLMTSSTLRWVTATKGQHPDHAVVGSTETVPDESKDSQPVDMADDDKTEPVLTRKIYICRAMHEGVWIPGQLRFGKQGCQVSVHGKVSIHTRYEILVNIDNGGRLSWEKWNKFHVLPVGAVSGGEAYVARKSYSQPEPNKETNELFGLSHLMGKLEINSMNFGKISIITPDGLEKEYSEGEILVETEPESYELASLNLITNKERIQRDRVALGSGILANEGPASAQVDTAITYDTNYTLYWGQGKAMLKGLKTVLRAPNGTILGEIKWGISDKEDRKGVTTVEKFLEPGTAVNVTLFGNKTDTETPYTAKLVAMFKDGADKARTVQGTRYEQEMKDLTPEFSPIYFIGNNSLVPTTTTTTTTTTSTTTTTTTTTTSKTSTPSVTQEPPQKDKDDDSSSGKGENSSMMNDEASHKQAKVKVDGSSDATTLLLPSLLLLFVHLALKHLS